MSFQLLYMPYFKWTKPEINKPTLFIHVFYENRENVHVLLLLLLLLLPLLSIVKVSWCVKSR